MSRFLSRDDLFSVLGYFLLVGVNQFRETPLPFPMISVLAAGMLGIFWLASTSVRARNADRNPNARVIFWGLVALASAVISAL